MLNLLLVRHAPTLTNAEKRYPHLSEDAPLSPQGRRLAAQLRLPDLPQAQVYTSPQLRARQTAQLCGFIPVQSRSLREADFGIMAGHTWAELERTFADAPRQWIEALQDPHQDSGPPQGDTGRGFHQRLQLWLSALPHTGNVVAFTHAGSLQAFLRLTVQLSGVETPPGSYALLKRAAQTWWLSALVPPP